MSRSQRAQRRIVVVQSSEAAHHPRHHYRIAASLSEAGYQVQMLAQPDRSGGHPDAVPTAYLPRRKSRLARMLTGPITMWRATQRRPDAVVAVSLDLLPWAVAAKGWRTPVVVFDSNEEYDNDMMLRDYIPTPLRPAMRQIVRRGEPWLAGRLSAATTAVPATQDKYVSAGVKSVLVRNFPPQKVVAGVTRTAPFSHDVMFGGILDREMVETVCETAVRLDALRGRPARWIIAARQYGPDDRAHLEQRLSDHGLRDQFTLRYNVPFTDMPSVLSAGRVGFVFFSGLAAPQRIFEYMACGIPFVGCDLPWMSDYIRGQGVALLASPNPDAYAEGLAQLLDDESLFREMSQRGAALAAGEYNWESESQHLIGLFDELLGVDRAAAAANGRPSASP